MGKEIEIIIDADGTVHMDAIGFEGKGCHEILEAYQRALGKLKTSKRKAEFYQAKVQVKTKIGR